MLVKKYFYSLPLIFTLIIILGCFHSHKNNIFHETSNNHDKTRERMKPESNEVSNKIISLAEIQRQNNELLILRPVTESESIEEARRREEIKKLCSVNKDSYIVLEKLIQNDDFSIRSEAYLQLLELNKDNNSRFNDVLKKALRDNDYRVRGRIFLGLLSEKYDFKSLPCDLIGEDESDEIIRNIYSHALDDARMITQMDVYKRGRQDLSFSPSTMQEILLEQIFLKKPEYIENVKNILFDSNENESLKNILIDIIDRMPYSEEIKHNTYLPILFDREAKISLKLSISNKFDNSDTDIMMPLLDYYINEDGNGAIFSILNNFKDNQEFKYFLINRLKVADINNEKIAQLLYKCNLKSNEEDMSNILKSKDYKPEIKEVVFKLIWINDMRGLLPLVETFITNENERIRKAALYCKYELLNK